MYFNSVCFLLSYMLEIYIHVIKFIHFSSIEYSIMWLYQILWIHAPKDGHLSHSQFYPIINNIETNIFVLVSPSTCFSTYITSKNITVGSQNMYIFNFSRYYHITLQISWPIIPPTRSVRFLDMLTFSQLSNIVFFIKSYISLSSKMIKIIL